MPQEGVGAVLLFLALPVELFLAPPPVGAGGFWANKASGAANNSESRKGLPKRCVSMRNLQAGRKDTLYYSGKQLLPGNLSARGCPLGKVPCRRRALGRGWPAQVRVPARATPCLAM